MTLKEVPLFDPALLQDLDWSGAPPLSPQVSLSCPGPGLLLRPLSSEDYSRGFLKVLAELTHTGDVSEEQFTSQFQHMKQTGDYYVLVVEDTSLGQLVATATLITEHKYIHSCAKRGRVEEVVVCNARRGQELGKLLVSTLVLLSQKLGCYKVTLDCSPQNAAFYHKCGFSSSGEASMQRRFFD